MAMERNESAERFNEGLKLAIDRCRELRVMQNVKLWDSIADSLNGIRLKGMRIVNSGALTERQVDEELGKVRAALGAKD